MKKLFLIVLLLLGLIGCGPGIMPIRTGILTTPNMTIEAIDKSFVIRSNEIFKTPFHNKTWCRRKDTSYEDLINEGAKKVKINFDNNEPSLFGVIQFCNHHDAAYIYIHHTISDQHIIQIPSKYVKLARSGRTTMIYQKIGEYTNFNEEHYGWVLWLSNRPFE